MAGIAGLAGAVAPGSAGVAAPPTDRPQPPGGVLGGQVALGLGEQLVADHELADVGPQQRRIEVGVDLPARRSSPSPNGAWCQPIEYGNGRLNSPS